MSRLSALSNILAILCVITVHASLFEADTIKDNQLKTPNSIDITVFHIEKNKTASENVSRLIERQLSISLFHEQNWRLGAPHNLICNTAQMMDQSFFPAGCDLRIIVRCNVPQKVESLFTNILRICIEQGDCLSI